MRDGVEGNNEQKWQKRSERRCRQGSVFACYCRYNGKTMQVVLKTHVFRPALWIKEGIINTIIVILLVKDMLYQETYI